MSTQDKAAVLRQMDGAARDRSPRIVSVQCGYTQTRRRVWGLQLRRRLGAEDDRAFLEFQGQVTAQKGDVRQSSATGVGGQVGLEFFRRPRSRRHDAAGGPTRPC